MNFHSIHFKNFCLGPSLVCIVSVLKKIIFLFLFVPNWNFSTLQVKCNLGEMLNLLKACPVWIWEIHSNFLSCWKHVRVIHTVASKCLSYHFGWRNCRHSWLPDNADLRLSSAGFILVASQKISLTSFEKVSKIILYVANKSFIVLF